VKAELWLEEVTVKHARGIYQLWNSSQYFLGFFKDENAKDVNKIFLVFIQF